MPIKNKRDDSDGNKPIFKEPLFGLHHGLIVLFIVLLLTGLAFDIASKQIRSRPAPMCGDGTLYDSCSLIKPYFCEAGVLIERASECGCNQGTRISEDSCISKYGMGEQNSSYGYVLNGKEENIDFPVYESLNLYLSKLSKVIEGSSGKPTRGDFKIKSLDEPEQKNLLQPLIVKISEKTGNEEDQVRIAISLVQSIPYGFSNKTSVLGSNDGVNYSRYPYEVLYDHAGVCGEKTALLAFLLREMGYKTAFFYYAEENHEALGIGCPIEDSVDNSGYCFIETTGPAIISDNGIEYVGGIKLKSKPEIIPISEGKSIGKNWPEYRDAKTMNQIRHGLVLFKNFQLHRLEKRYGLTKEYHAA